MNTTKKKNMCPVTLFASICMWCMPSNSEDKGATVAVDVSPPPAGYASDSWVLNGKVSWPEELERRERELHAYLADQSPARAEKYGFRNGHTPALAWDWFSSHPVGFGGVPHVLLQTLLSLDPATETDPVLLELANVWKKRSVIPSEQNQPHYTLDHLGFSPHPDDYHDGVAMAPDDRQHQLPNGLVFDPNVEPKEKWWVDYRLKLMRDGFIGSIFKALNPDYEPKIAKLLVLIRGKLRNRLYGGEIDYERDLNRMQEPPMVDAAFFSCSACHMGRVLVGGKLDDEGNIIEPGSMMFLPGMPNTEIEAQYFSKLLMQSGAALVESGFSIDADKLPHPEAIVPSKNAILALYTRMLTRALDPELVKTIYGPSDELVRRAKLQTYWVAKDFPSYIGGLIGVAVKTQYIYRQIGERYAYAANNPKRQSPEQPVPDVFGDRVGQMDAFGIASGLVAIHTYRKDNSFLSFMYKDNQDNPIFAGIDTVPGFSGRVDLIDAGPRIRQTIHEWAPPVPAPIDIKSLNWSGHRKLANWDGNQGASARALASGTSATGDPMKVNVRIHEPLNPLINHMPPPPYPFAVDREKASRGMALFMGEGRLPQSEACAGCHQPNKDWIFTTKKLGVDENRAILNTDVSRYGLATLVMEACNIFIRKNPGNDWCLPRDEEGNVETDWEKSNDDYFKDTPGRVRAGTHGYKVDMLHGIWARAPYLHNGSVPTLMNLICPDTRPTEFYRGNLFYNESMVGFEWRVAPRQRYSEHDITQVKKYDTRQFGRSNSGHQFGASLCPDISDLDPLTESHAIVQRILASDVGDLLEYLKTL